MSAAKYGTAAEVKLANDVVVVGACCLALATLVPISLYQTGVLGSLRDPPLSAFDSERITTSKVAHPFGVPDGLLGLASFSTTLALALAARSNPLAKKLLGAKLTVDLSMAGFNAVRQVVSFGKLCSWCMGTAVSTGVMGYAGRETIRHTWSEAADCVKAGIEAATR